MLKEAILSLLSPTRWLTVIVGEEFPIDLRMLKSFRCLRPLKMVSKVPSKLPVELSLATETSHFAQTELQN